MMDRRRFIAAGGAIALTPLAAATARQAALAAGMAEIKWDRDTCVRCNMVISDRRFAAEMRGGEKNTCQVRRHRLPVFWLRDKASAASLDGGRRHPAVGGRLDGQERRPGSTPRKAHYLGGRLSPMGYNQAAVAAEAGLSISRKCARLWPRESRRRHGIVLAKRKGK
jgi:copper chaperone NosL